MPPLVQLELHRHGIGLVPDPGETPPSSAILFVDADGGRPLRTCTCKTSKRRTCAHLTALGEQAAAVEKAFGGLQGWERRFTGSLWYRLAQLLHQGGDQPSARVRVRRTRGEEDGGKRSAVRVTAPDGALLAVYLDDSPARIRFLERTGKAPAGYADRAQLLERLALFQLSHQERLLANRGMKSNRQAWEESFWFRLAYHCVREHADGGRFRPAIDQQSGDFTFTFHASGAERGDREAGGEPAVGRAVVRITMPRNRVRAALKLLAAAFPEQDDLAIHPLPLRSLFHVAASTELDDIEVRPVIEALQEGGEARYIARDDLERFRYGNLVYVRELGLLAELERAGKERSFQAPRAMRLERSQVPSFLARHAEALEDGSLVLDEPLRDLTIWDQIERIEITPEMLERSWTWLSVRYGIGNQSISLADILRARAAGLPYLETEDGWIDLNAPVFRHLDQLFGRAGAKDQAREPAFDDQDRVRLAPRDLLRLAAGGPAPVAVAGEAERKALLERLLHLEPASPFTPPAGLESTLRPYQVHGVDWLRFLWQNRLGGLLCDDMGLGKTHQAMALMLCLREQEGVTAPSLVVCPTSVLAHWASKIRDHAPGLRAAVYHGLQRDLDTALGDADVVITSYGVLRRDVERLAAVPLALAVFDEIQQIKNRGTQAYRAAVQLDAELKLGLTGTPIENALDELKALFDLVLPGYLGSDADFAERYLEEVGREIEGPGDAPGGRLAALRRQINPFVLRRRKATVLDELPEKIEDLYTCTLSDDQVKLYRDALERRGVVLREQLSRDDGGKLPYIHVFALLNLLKQICDHPALAQRQLDRADDYRSGKWDLFRELLQQALDSGQKVVVFSQYLGMIELMGRHLEQLGVPYVTLTGASRDRGALVDRFNQDPECRVFLGSLKAGGTGIDLIGGSVVVHYDRWWNAAREDQATDRVYRIGQKRAVQVVKLVTDGTLEEKIAAIIDRKRRLLDAVVEEDDAALAKMFTRDELLELLSPL